MTSLEVVLSLAGIKDLTDYHQLSEDLNNAKSLLDKYYQPSNPFFKEWRTFFGYADQYKTLPKIIEKDYNAKRVSNAWLKFWEIYLTYQAIEKKDDGEEFKTFFNAELPGSSLCAFNHYVRTNFPDGKFDWIASSLVGSGTMSKDITNKVGPSYSGPNKASHVKVHHMKLLGYLRIS